MLEYFDYDRHLYKEKKLRADRNRLKGMFLNDAYEMSLETEKRLAELEFREARRKLSFYDNDERFIELKKRILEIRKKERARQEYLQKQKMLKFEGLASTFISEHEYVTIGSDSLCIPGFLKLHFIYDSIYCLLESDKDILPKKYISSILFKIDGNDFNGYVINAKIIFKNENMTICFASVGTQGCAHFLMRKLISFYAFQGFNVKNFSRISIIEEEE